MKKRNDAQSIENISIMCTQNGTHYKFIIIFATDSPNAMVIISSREFRANQRKYFDLAKSDDVVITSRKHGNYKLIPVSNNDKIVSGDILQARISKGIADCEKRRG